MPQMSPLMWEILFLIMISLFIVLMSKVYFSNMNSEITLKNQKTLKTNNLNWPW
uniref:ATP synthase F0 subunit 8 n=1 Tax=Spinactaletes boneti TaxID=2736147 RepID=UPI001EDE8E61|nr:ATP synthase F0 subunit 8 [Spinactaletes boneti]UJY98019.1 ATP synthase F0 subunit 8 [Spinactaletes boneti]